MREGRREEEEGGRGGKERGEGRRGREEGEREGEERKRGREKDQDGQIRRRIRQTERQREGDNFVKKWEAILSTYSGRTILEVDVGGKVGVVGGVASGVVGDRLCMCACVMVIVTADLLFSIRKLFDIKIHIRVLTGSPRMRWCSASVGRRYSGPFQVQKALASW